MLRVSAAILKLVTKAHRGYSYKSREKRESYKRQRERESYKRQRESYKNKVTKDKERVTKDRERESYKISGVQASAE